MAIKNSSVGLIKAISHLLMFPVFRGHCFGHEPLIIELTGLIKHTTSTITTTTPGHEPLITELTGLIKKTTSTITTTTTRHEPLISELTGLIKKDYKHCYNNNNYWA